jgi:surface-adhesin protein E
MKPGTLAAIATLMVAAAMNSAAIAADWVEVGADTQAKYYVDVESIKVDGENASVLKRGILTQVMTETLGGASATFKETIGTIEIDCMRRINRVTQIDMIGDNGEVVWSSGPMKKRMWEDVRPNTHAETTIEIVCARLK